MSQLAWRLTVGLALAFLIGAGSLLAQGNLGTITGTVTDPSGAAVPGAAVTATNSATGISTKVTSTSTGNYAIPLLQAGTYQVTVEASGFKKYVAPGVVVNLASVVTLNPRLEIGPVAQSIEVQAAATPLQRDTSDRSTVISSRDLETLPIVAQSEQRNPGFYMTLSPGTTGRGTATPTASGSGRQLNTTVNGSQSGSTEFYLDGALIGQPGQMAGDFRQLWLFPVDAVGEFKVYTQNPPAEFGDSGLGIMTFVTKTGTNEFHGSVYEYLRNDALDARGFFAARVPANKQNEFGATIGGPIKKDKTFFFGWYSGYRLAQEATNVLDTLPTTAMKNGDLSNILGGQIMTCGPIVNGVRTSAPCYDALGRPVYSGAIYDPATTRTVAAGAIDPKTGLVNISGSSAILRDPFAGNIITADRIDPVAKKMFSYFPDIAPCASCPYGYQRNWLPAFAVHNSTDNYAVKIDHSLTDRQRLMGEYLWANTLNPTASKWPKPIGEGSNSTIHRNLARLSHDWIITPTFVNHWVLGFNRVRSDSFPEAGLGWPAVLGWSGVPQTGTGSTWPELDIGGLGNAYARQGQSYNAANIYTVVETLAWTKGKHNFRAGFSYIKEQLNTWGTTYQSGRLQFNSGTTSLPGSVFNDANPASTAYSDSCSPGNPCTGIGAAGFLLGNISTGNAGLSLAEPAERTSRYGFYAQDDWKVTPKLTLNLGLRYELMLPVVDAHNIRSWFNPLLPNPGAGNLPGALEFATASRRSPTPADTKAFGPRIGLAYAINDKTVVRSSYGIIYSAGGAYRPFGLGTQLGYSAANGVPEDLSLGFTGALPAITLSGGWPASQFPALPFINPTYQNGQGPPTWGAYPGDGNLPYLQNWTFDIQRELPGQVVLDMAYVGTKGTHLSSRLMNTNVVPTSNLKYGDLLFATISDPAVQALSVVQAMPVDPATGSHSPFAGFQALWGGGATLGQALRPYPQYTIDTRQGTSQMVDFGEAVGNSSYNSLQIQARKRFSQGLTFLASFTWSKTLTDAGSLFNEFSGFTQDFYNARAEKALSLNDYPENLVFAYQYELPFGPGKKFANGGGWPGKVIGGWSLAGVHQYRAGEPQEVASGSNPLNPYFGPNSFLTRPNVVPGVPQKSSALMNGTWDPNAIGATGATLNLNAWSFPSKYTFGNAPPTNGGIRRFPYFTEDISLLKSTSVSERVKLEFRADFLNLFNRTLFGFDQGGDQYGSVLQGNQLASGINGFGHVTAQSNFPREIQFGLKITF